MGAMSHWPIFLLIIVVVMLFSGRGKLSGLMGDAAKGIKAFKDGLKDEHGDPVKPAEAPGVLPRTDAEKEQLKS